MAYPPNYNHERNSRALAKARKALDKRQKREEKSLERKPEHVGDDQQLERRKSDSEHK